MLRFGWTLKSLKEIRFNLLILESNKHLISLYNISTESNFKVKNKGNGRQLKKPLIIEQILLVCTSGNV